MSRPVCRDFQKGTCNRGSTCKYLHNRPRINDGDVPIGNASPATRPGRPQVKYAVMPRGNRHTVCKFFLDSACTRPDCRFKHWQSEFGDINKVAEVKAHENKIRALVLSGGLLYTGSADQTIKVWDCASGECKTTVSVPGEVNSLFFLEGWLFCGFTDPVSKQGIIRAWNFQTQCQTDLIGHRATVYCIAACNRVIFSGSQDATIMMWQFDEATNSFRSIHQFTGHSGAIFSLLFVNNFLFSASADASIRVWDMSSGTCAQVLEGHQGPVMGLLQFGDSILSVSIDNTMRMWSTQTLDLTQVFQGENDGITSICGTVDMQGRPVVLLGYSQGSIGVYELPSFAFRGLLRGHKGGHVSTILDAQGMFASPNGGNAFFSAGSDGVFKLWQWIPQPLQ
eukprot:GILI01008668.1.p1 GENE.GILI01008668.1~~GILI01008668.1.p1  ORF type:complete len:395 (+),score=60.24 GILI01008668.1:123-1307(+)